MWVISKLTNISDRNRRIRDRSYDRLREFGKEEILRIHRKCSKAGRTWTDKIRDEGSIDFLMYEFERRVERRADVFSIAAFVMHYVVDKHPFWDVSHRSAFELSDVVLRAFGYKIRALTDEKIAFVRSIDSKGLSENDVERWLRRRAVKDID